jgi:hypothetical protein
LGFATLEDSEAYIKYPHHRKWFNKLWFSEQMGYYCGPGGIPPNKSGWYISRPVMNIRGMGLRSKRIYIQKGDVSVVGPGDFWCEWFDGHQYSVDFQNDHGIWKSISVYKAERNIENLSSFIKWERCNKDFYLPSIFNDLLDLNVINVEFINNNPIEVHLRSSFDPKEDILIPIWEGQEKTIDIYRQLGYKFIDSKDNCDGFLDIPRIGFMIKNRKE